MTKYALACALVALSTVPAAASDDAALAWLRRNAHPVATVDPASPDTSDLAPLVEKLRGVRVVGAGEATHGTREFFQLKHRLLRALAERGLIGAFAIEANYADAVAIDAYVQGGPGDPEKLIAAMGFWTWDTEEVLDLVRWLRAYNQDHARHIAFRGIDIQNGATNLALALDFLERVNPADAPQRARFADFLAAATSIGAGYRFTNTIPPARLAELRQDSEALALYFDAQRDALISAGGVDGYETAQGAATAAAWYFVMQAPKSAWRFRNFRQEYDVRDRAMADLTEQALARTAPGEAVFLWAHNAHVGKARHMDNRMTLGGFLADDLGTGYAALGFTFDHGTFQAMPPRDAANPSPTLTEMRVGPAPADHAEAKLRRVPGACWWADLRGLSAGTPAYAWFKEPHPLRWTGANYSVALMAKHKPTSLLDNYDLLLFVRETERARPLPSR